MFEKIGEFLNSPKIAKPYLIIVLAYMSAVAPLSTDMYLPALKNVQTSFETSEFYTQLSISAFFVAFALGQLIYGPLSDIYGRRKPLLAGVALFIVASILCANTQNIYAFIFFRFVQALGGCAGVVIARAVINDKFDTAQGASVLALMMIVGSIAPMLAPTFGAFILDFGGWRVIFGTLFVLGIILFCMIFLGLRESAIIDKSLKLGFKPVFINYARILQNRKFFIFTLSSALTMAAMFAYITGSAFVFKEHFGLSSKEFGLIFGVNALSMTIFSAINAKIVQKISPFVILQFAFLAMIVGALCLLGCGLLGLGFWAFEVCLFFTLGMKGLIIPNAVVLAMARFKGKSGSASAVLGAVQMAVAGLIAAIVGAAGANHPFSLAVVMAICIFLGYGVYLCANKKFTKNLKRKFS
ncbi:multidrug effflux MFS transporter [Campylobacter sp. VBCF_06 NA8]|uniref:multidrug effflux MFS transporter n=1 Tax=unclassified Campylobacter TaxID=2593542 RepID=UPI0022E9F995|nr:MULTISPECIES: multidrug effflux MFS transporter [unclassified Campylobacter]MDA3046543.1 multidrug effflux MFS transporter [Campylobacter sp. VBCF_06 NA8]MDA3054108.1 multidrug effflux MFS transporter [Campylobacter sp. VBCF_07 NA4]MDA3060005.1 multidrug effflux MFS transporter [Campylobacter sp. VBCF_02 NA5]MDA3069519.1 multidrug effflux MFS transporter [Campylobacter sp. VBCF_08 NA3]WBR53600.1 multidrug effflux MFS transporter [Campylobacter sp. VBCF_01 NA2]